MILERWQDRVRAAAADGRPLCLRGGGSKDFYGGVPCGEGFDTREYSGILTYEPTELVITARAGTTLAEIEDALAERGQMLAFEPPHFGAADRPATIGGVVAAGLSGPRRATAGAVRDFVLGVRLLDGQGRLLRFGGEVMKNVAGYDVSRLLAGSLGTLGILAEVSLKVLPRPASEQTCVLELPQSAAIERINRLAGQPLPISASAWLDERLHVRLSGAPSAVHAAAAAVGGDPLAADRAAAFWHSMRDQTHDVFHGPGAGDGARLWRLAVPAVASPLDIAGAQCFEWGGAQRWVRTTADASHIRAVAAAAGGHATLFRRSTGAGATADEVFTVPAAPIMAIHRRLKHAFDPARIFNRGRLYAEL